MYLFILHLINYTVFNYTTRHSFRHGKEHKYVCTINKVILVYWQ
jgi:hypothetical protein